MRLRDLVCTLSCALLWSGGCGGEAGPIEPTGSVVLGGSDADGKFVPFVDGSDVELVEGAQGGFHVWVRYRAGGDSGLDAELQRSANRVSDGQLILRSASDTTMVEESAPMPMFMCPSPVGISVIDAPVRFSLRFVPAGGAAPVEGAITLVPRCPADNRDFCLRICTG